MVKVRPFDEEYVPVLAGEDDIQSVKDSGLSAKNKREIMDQFNEMGESEKVQRVLQTKDSVIVIKQHPDPSKPIMANGQIIGFDDTKSRIKIERRTKDGKPVTYKDPTTGESRFKLKISQQSVKTAAKWALAIIIIIAIAVVGYLAYQKIKGINWGSLFSGAVTGMSADIRGEAREAVKGMQEDIRAGVQGMQEDWSAGVRQTQDDISRGMQQTQQDISKGMRQWTDDAAYMQDKAGSQWQKLSEDLGAEAAARQKKLAEDVAWQQKQFEQSEQGKQVAAQQAEMKKIGEQVQKQQQKQQEDWNKLVGKQQEELHKVGKSLESGLDLTKVGFMGKKK